MTTSTIMSKTKAVDKVCRSYKLEGHISELKQDPILYVYFYHMLSCTCIAISRAVSQKESLILMHVI